jgi:flagella basal body P-ring formation protein FlgA
VSLISKLTIISVFFAAVSVLAAPADSLQEKLKKGIQAKLGSAAARIEFSSPLRWAKSEAPADEVERVEVLAVNARGEAQFVAKSKDAAAQGTVSYSAWVPARVATRRVMPGETLHSESFMTQEVNIATGQAYEFRGVILPIDADVNALESRQTILEGHFLSSSAVRKVPDVRRGDIVRIHLISNGVTLSTLGVAEETGYLNNPLRVMTQKTKRELLGQLSPGRIVEVKL